MTQRFGIIFCGPPGHFSVWNVTPDGELMDREGVEVLGQMAIRAGAADYRIFPLDEQEEFPDGVKAAARGFLDPHQVERFREMLRAAGGLPEQSLGQMH